MFKRISIFVSVILTAAFIFSSAAFADFTADYDPEAVVADIYAYELTKNDASDIQGWIDGELSENAGQSSEWFAIMLGRSGGHDLTGYAAALEKYIAENNIPSATSRMKDALALLAAGGSRQAADDIAESSVGEQGIMSLIYGLHLLNNGCSCSRYTVGTLTEELLSMQFDDGGWAIMGENGDIDVTAMTVQALAPQYDTDEKVKVSIDRAVTFLSDKQQDDGGYKSFGTANPESTAQVIIAAVSVGIDIRTDERFIKNGNDLIDGMMMYRLDDGSFCHTQDGDTNETATTQACLALTAYLLMEREDGLLYDFSRSDQAVPEEKAPTVTTADPVTVTAVSETQAVTTAKAPGTVAPAETGNSTDYKPIAYAVIAVLAVIVCAVLFVLKKRRASNFIAVIIAAAAAVCFIFFTDFKSKEEYYSGTDTVKTDVIGTVTMTIRCDTIVGKDDSPYVPADGIILDTTGFEIEEGDTVYDILTEAAKKYNIQLQANGSYIAGIAYLYEYDYGDLSGWIYHVNYDAPFVMCSDYKLKDGDVIEWLYTCELGNDL